MNTGVQANAIRPEKIRTSDHFIDLIDQFCDRTKGAEILKGDLEVIWEVAAETQQDIKKALESALNSVLDKRRSETVRDTLTSVIESADNGAGLFVADVMRISRMRTIKKEKNVDDVLENFRNAARVALEFLPYVDV